MQGLATAREKPPGAKTVANNGKNRAQNNGNRWKLGRGLTSGWTPEDRAAALRASRRSVECDGGILVMPG
jgi:hypothetical protein